MEQQPFPIDNCVFSNCIPDSMSGGAAVGDYNNDGYPDIFVARLFGRDMLYRNNHDGTFSDVSMSAGLSMTQNHRSNGVLWVDVDNDGDLDLYVLTLGNPLGATPNGNRYFFYVNNGDGTFTEDAIRRGLAFDDGSARYGTSATCGDYDNDGHIDIHINQWDQNGTFIDVLHTRLLRNRGDGTFEDVTNVHDFYEHGFEQPLTRETFFTSTFADMDKDGDADLLMSGDFTRSRFYRNDNGHYVDITESSKCCDEDNGMGTAFGDLDKNGYLDWFITSVWDEGKTGNRMFMNDGSNVFTDMTDETNTREADWGWGAHMFDMDNDGDLDVLNTNGQYYNKEFFVTDKTRLWENVNGNGMNMPEVAADYGITDNGIGKSAIALDFDLDGDLDIVISQTGPGIILYENQLNNQNDWIRIRAQGSMTNVLGYGVQITVWPRQGDLPLYQEMGVGGHFLGHSEAAVAQFGLGNLGSNSIYRIQAYFPVSRQTAILSNVMKNQEIIIEEPIIDDSSNQSSNTSDNSSSSNNSNSNESSSSNIILPSIVIISIIMLII